MKVRQYMMSRFAELTKTAKVEQVRAHEKDRFDIVLEGNVILRVNKAELAALKLKVSK